MAKIYKYESRIVVEFSNKKRASYSRKRYGTLLEKIVNLSMEKDKKVWNYYENKNHELHIYYWDQRLQKEIIIIVDPEFEYLVFEYYIQTNHNGYPQTRTQGQKQYIHHMVLNTKELVDHIDRNILNNKKSNLRIASKSLNAYNRDIQSNNTSGSTGVSKTENGWRARIQFSGKSREERFDTKEEAINKRLEWEKELKINKTL